MVLLYYMNYITTNIRLAEEDYIRLKAEAAQKRKSFAEVVRQKITKKKSALTDRQVTTLLLELESVAEENAKSLKSFNSVEALREIRAKGK